MTNKNKLKFVLLIVMMFIVTIEGAEYTTTKEKSDGGFRIRASALWQYETGIYLGPGDFSVLNKPSGGIYDVKYNITHKTNNYKVSQYYSKYRYYSIANRWEKLGDIRVDFSSPGPQ